MFYRIKNRFARIVLLIAMAALSIYAVYMAVEDTGYMRARYYHNSVENAP